MAENNELTTPPENNNSEQTPVQETEPKEKVTLSMADKKENVKTQEAGAPAATKQEAPVATAGSIRINKGNIGTFIK